MNLTSKAQTILTQLNTGETKLGDLRKIAKDIKKDHDLALELWSTKGFYARQLAILILDKKLLHQEFLDQITKDIQQHDDSERTHLADWLMANQLMKDKKTVALLESWEDSPSSIQRRLFWYYQARLRWTGQTPPDNTETLLSAIEKKIAKETPDVQWAMNFTAGQIGIFDEPYRARCIALGEKIGLYKDDFVHKGCTPNYLPEFISIQVSKNKK